MVFASTPVFLAWHSVIGGIRVRSELVCGLRCRRWLVARSAVGRHGAANHRPAHADVARGHGEDARSDLRHGDARERRLVNSFPRGAACVAARCIAYADARRMADRRSAWRLHAHGDCVSGSVVLGPVLMHDIPAVLTVILLAYFVHVGTSTLIESVDVIIDPRLGRNECTVTAVPRPGCRDCEGASGDRICKYLPPAGKRS